MGIRDLAIMLAYASDQIDALIRAGRAHEALGQARFMRTCGHPDADRLMATAWRAIRAETEQRAAVEREIAV
jgi:hypothetical protein